MSACTVDGLVVVSTHGWLQMTLWTFVVRLPVMVARKTSTVVVDGDGLTVATYVFATVEFAVLC
jgi:hypothetical protein